MKNFPSFKQFLKEREEQEPICSGKIGSTEIIIKYPPDYDVSYVYDIGLESERDKMYFVCKKRGNKVGKLISKIKQYPMRKLWNIE